MTYGSFINEEVNCDGGLQGSEKLKQNLKPNEQPVKVDDKVQDNIRQVKTVAGQWHTFIHLSMHPSTLPSTHASIQPPFHPPIHPSTHLSSIQFVCPPTLPSVLYSVCSSHSPSVVGMACQVSATLVSAIGAMTVELGRRIAPVIVEQGGKVSTSPRQRIVVNMSAVVRKQLVSLSGQQQNLQCTEVEARENKLPKGKALTEMPRFKVVDWVQKGFILWWRPWIKLFSLWECVLRGASCARKWLCPLRE